MLSLATLSAVCILACTLFEAWLFTFLQASNILQARWWEDVDFLQFTETFCQGGNHVKASKWSACTYIHQLVQQRACTSILYLCINFERVYVSTSACTSTCVSILRFCINFERVLTCASTSFSTHTFLLKDRAWGNFLENNDASSIFCKSADEKEFSYSPKIQISRLSSNQRRASWVQVEERQLFKSTSTTPSLSNQREFSHRWWG